MMAAISVVRQKTMKVSVDAAKFGILQSTLCYHIKTNRRVGAGTPTVLAPKEKEIVATLQVLQDIGFGLSSKIIGIVIRDYLHDQQYRFKDGIPGKDYF